MKFVIKFWLSTFAILALIACKKSEEGLKPKSNSINKILPLGASRVEGARPDFESFRYELWKSLIADNWTFDFIGTQTDESSYSPYNGNEFDLDHEGRGGWKSGEILNGLNKWLQETGSPNIVLFSSPGGNDVLEGLDYDQTISTINSIIDVLQLNNPNVIILIEQPAQGHSSMMTTELTNTFNQLQQDIFTIAIDKSNSTSQVIAVDMFTGFEDKYLADDVHYNEDGAKFIADKYYNALATVLK